MVEVRTLWILGHVDHGRLSAETGFALEFFGLVVQFYEALIVGLVRQVVGIQIPHTRILPKSGILERQRTYGSHLLKPFVACALADSTGVEFPSFRNFTMLLRG